MISVIELVAANSISSEKERKRNVIETLYHHSDLSIQEISNQVDMDITDVQKVVDEIREKNVLEILVEQSKTPVKQIMSSKVVSLEHIKTVYDASVLMTSEGVGCVLVTANNKPYGIVTERDIVHGISGTDISLKKITLEEFASRPIITAGPEQTIEEVADIMIRGQIRRLPIVQNDRLVGILTITDLAKFLSPTRRAGLAESILRTISRAVFPDLTTRSKLFYQSSFRSEHIQQIHVS